MKAKLNTVDYQIKDEGDFFSIYFISDKAIDLIVSEIEKNPNLQSSSIVRENDFIKLEILNESKNNIISWATSHLLIGENI